VGQHLSFMPLGKATEGYAKVRTGLGKSDRQGSQGACGNVLQGLMAICHAAENGGHRRKSLT